MGGEEGALGDFLCMLSEGDEFCCVSVHSHCKWSSNIVCIANQINSRFVYLYFNRNLR